MAQKSTQLNELLEYARGKTEKFFAALPQAEREADGTWEKWAPKDVLAHLTFWQNASVDALNTLDQAPPEQEPFEERNRKNYLHYEKRPYAEIYADYKDTLEMILSRVRALNDVELTEPDHFPRLVNGASVQSNVLGNAYSHTFTHLAELVAKRTDAATGLKLQEHATFKLLEFDASPRAKGVALYNLACAYALAQDSARTVELLRESFPLRPDLLEYSKQDTDFDAVRDRPEFQALYAI